MNKKIISALLCGAMVLSCAAPVMAADKAGDGQKIALVGKSAGNAFFEIADNFFVHFVFLPWKYSFYLQLLPCYKRAATYVIK